MSPRSTVFAALGVLLLVSARPAAQRATVTRGATRSGQTFLVWRESAETSVQYRVYRAESPITSSADLARADYLGEVDDKSSRNQGRSLASFSEHGWIIQSGGPELAANVGLFVYTIERPTSQAFYAVTSVRLGIEDFTVVPNRNATVTGLLELPAMPMPVLQSSDAEGETWAHWVGDRKTPFQPALYLWPSEGFNFRYERGTAPGPHGVVVRLHAAGQTYLQGWPQRFEVPEDVDILAPSDLQPYTSFSFWFGAQERLPALPHVDTPVWNYTEQRTLWLLDQLLAVSGSALDHERVYASGGSMGAIGAMYLAEERPETFAAILCRNGLYDLEATDYRNPGIFESLFGSFSLGLKTLAGLSILQRTNATFMANLDPRTEWPVVRTINGRNDDVVGWMSAVELYRGLARAYRPAVHYFDERTHTPRGYWEDVERDLLARTFSTRRDRPSLRFDHCSLDQDPGHGGRTEGDSVGTINGTVEYGVKTAEATADALSFEVFLRDQGALDDALVPTGWVEATPRRTGPFVLAPGEPVHFTLRENGALVDEHLLFADANGLVHTPRLPLEKTRRDARFERVPAGALASLFGPLFLGAAPIPGDRMQVLLQGQPGAPWTLFLSLGNAQGPTGTLAGVDLLVLGGRFGADGRAERWLDLPAVLPPSTWIYGRARLTSGFTTTVGVAVQAWP